MATDSCLLIYVDDKVEWASNFVRGYFTKCATGGDVVDFHEWIAGRIEFFIGNGEDIPALKRSAKPVKLLHLLNSLAVAPNDPENARVIAALTSCRYLILDVVLHAQKNAAGKTQMDLFRDGLLHELDCVKIARKCLVVNPKIKILFLSAYYSESEETQRDSIVLDFERACLRSDGTPVEAGQVAFYKRHKSTKGHVADFEAVADRGKELADGLTMLRQIGEDLYREYRGALPPLRISPFVDFVFGLPFYRDLRRKLELYATCGANVLIQGDSGSGKGLAAKLIHQSDPCRHDQPYVAVNVASLPPSLLESELFGHVQGAYTDASRDRLGRFETVGAGTILLDEIGDLDAHLQAKILRVTDERLFSKVGSCEESHFVGRIVSATRWPIQEWLDKENGFRADLYYRLGVLRLALPAFGSSGCAWDVFKWLLESEASTIRTASSTNRKLSFRKAIDEDSLELSELLNRYDWPGGIRQVSALAQRCMVLDWDSAGIKNGLVELDEELRSLKNETK